MQYRTVIYSAILIILRHICCGHTHAKYLAKRVEGIPFLLILLAYPETIGCEKTKEN